MTEIGRISIRVTPDLRGFREELYAELKKDESGARVKVKADFDEDGLKGKVEAAAKSADAKAKVKVDVDDNSIRNKLDSLNLAFERRLAGTLEKRPLIPTSIAEMQRRMDSLDLGWDKKLAALREAPLRELESKIKLRPALDEAGIEELRLRLAHENFTAKVKLETDTARLHNLLRSGQADFDKALDRIFTPKDRGPGFFSRLRSNLLPGGGGSGGGFGGGLGGLGLGSIGNFGSPANLLALFTLLPPALALAAPALTSLPALIAGVAAPIGVLTLGMDGFKKAAENAGLAAPKLDAKGKPKGDKLTVAGALKDIQDSVSEVFADGFTPIFRELLTVAGPAKTAMRGIAEGIVNIAQGVTDTLTSPALVNQMNTLFANISGALTIAAPGFSSFTTGLVNLATQVSTHFPGLANWFNQLGEKFSNWVTKISKDGTLDKAISGMKPVLDTVIGFVGKLVDAGLKLAADPQMMSGISTVLDSISNFIISSLPALTQLFNSLASLLHTLGLDKGNPQLQPANPNGTPGGPNSILPAAPGSGGKFSWYAPPSGVPYEKQGLLDKLETGRWWQENVFGPLGRFFSGNTQNQQNGLSGGPGSIGNWLGQNVGGPLGRFFTGNNQWQQSLGNGIANLPQTLDGLTNPGGSLSLGGLKIPTGQLVQDAENAVNQVKGVFERLPGAVEGIWGSIVSSAQNAMSQFASAISTGVDQAVSFFTSLPGKAVAAVQSMGAQLYSAGAAAMNQLNEGLKSVPIVGPVISGLEGILKNIPHSPAEEGPMSGLGWTALFTGGQAIGNQFQTGLENGFQGVIQSATDLLGQVHGVLANGGALPPGLKENLRDELKAIGTEYDTLKVQRDALDPKDKAGRKAISDQLKQLQTLRDQLKLGRDQLPELKKPTDKKDMNIGQLFGSELQKLPNVGANFAMANINQFEQDLGISGKGAIPTIANIGLQWATSQLSNLIGGGFGNKGLSGGDTHIHVQSVDEAMAVQRAQQQRQAMTYAGR